MDSQGGNESGGDSDNPEDNSSSRPGGDSDNSEDNSSSRPGGNADGQGSAASDVPEKPNDTSPKTGDSSFSPLLMAAILLLLAGTGLTGVFMGRLKKQ